MIDRSYVIVNTARAQFEKNMTETIVCAEWTDATAGAKGNSDVVSGAWPSVKWADKKAVLTVNYAKQLEWGQKYDTIITKQGGDTVEGIKKQEGRACSLHGIF